MSDPLNKELDLVLLPAINGETRYAPAPSQDDYDFARETIRGVVAKGAQMLEELSFVAEQSQHPRAYEVAGQLVTSITAAAEKLLTVKKHQQDISAKDSLQHHGPNGTFNNNLFVSSAEFMEMVRTPKVVTPVKQ